MNRARIVVRLAILGAIVTAVAVFFAVGFRRVPPAGAEVPVSAGER